MERIRDFVIMRYINSHLHYITVHICLAGGWRQRMVRAGACVAGQGGG